jgi:hypothetical protein
MKEGKIGYNRIKEHNTILSKITKDRRQKKLPRKQRENLACEVMKERKITKGSYGERAH